MGNKSRRAVTSSTSASKSSPTFGPRKLGDEREGVARRDSTSRQEGGDAAASAHGRSRRAVLGRLRCQLARTFGAGALDAPLSFSSSGTSEAASRLPAAAGAPSKEVHASPCKRLARALNPNCWPAAGTSGGSSFESSRADASNFRPAKEIQQQQQQQQQQQVVAGRQQTPEEGMGRAVAGCKTTSSSRLAALLSSPARVFWRAERKTRRRQSGCTELLAESGAGAQLEEAPSRGGTSRGGEGARSGGLKSKEQESELPGDQLLLQSEPSTRRSTGLPSAEFEQLHFLGNANGSGNGFHLEKEAADSEGGAKQEDPARGLAARRSRDENALEQQHYANENTLDSGAELRAAAAKRPPLEAAQPSVDGEAAAASGAVRGLSNEKCTRRQVELGGPLIQQLASAAAASSCVELPPPPQTGRLSRAAAAVSLQGRLQGGRGEEPDCPLKMEEEGKAQKEKKISFGSGKNEQPDGRLESSNLAQAAISSATQLSSTSTSTSSSQAPSGQRLGCPPVASTTKSAQTSSTRESLSPLIKPLASSCSSLASSSSGSSCLSLSVAAPNWSPASSSPELLEPSQTGPLHSQSGCGSSSGARAPKQQEGGGGGGGAPSAKQANSARLLFMQLASSGSESGQPAASPGPTTTTMGGSSLRFGLAGGKAASSLKRKPLLVRAPSSGVAGALKSNFRKLVKRQQSVDSYRMARELKSKQKRERERPKHQSNEAIPNESQQQAERCLSAKAPSSAQLSSLKRRDDHPGGPTRAQGGPPSTSEQKPAVSLQIRVDPYARPGSFDPLECRAALGTAGPVASNQTRPKATPPTSLSLGGVQVAGPDHGQKLLDGLVHSGARVAAGFLGAHQLLTSPAGQRQFSPKKFSNASTVSSSLAADLSRNTTAGSFSQICNNQPDSQSHSHTHTHQHQNSHSNIHSSTESSLLLLHLEQHRTSTTPTPTPSPTPSPQLNGELSTVRAPVQQQQQQQGAGFIKTALASRSLQAGALGLVASRMDAENEHLYDNKCGLGEDMKFLASLPELCDITFLVGETREPVCAVKSVLAARSRVFHKILFGNRMRRNGPPAALDGGAADRSGPTGSAASGRRRGSSAVGRGASGKSSSPIMMSGTGQRKQSSPSNQREWSVQADVSGYSGSSPAPSHTDEGWPGSGRLASGRVSVTSGGARLESRSFSQASTGSQQPLVIGPGQTATPAPPQKRLGAQKKGPKGSIRGEAGRLSRMFMKRASDPTIKQQQQQAPNQQSLANQNYLDKMSSSQMSTTMIIEEFEPDVFRQLIEYIHTGCVLLQARTLLGLLNAADYYGLEQLRRACLRFVSCCITVDTVCSLLSTAERYIQYKCTKTIVQRVLEFVDTHADEIFKLNAFGLLPEHVVRLILARDGLKADEQAKFSGVYTWCEHYCRSYELTDISNVMQNFLDLIQFHKISRSVLLQEIYPTRIVPDNVILIALAYQANPQYFEPQPMQARRMTLPNPSCLRSSPASNSGDDPQQKQEQEQEMPADSRTAQISASEQQSVMSAATNGGAAGEQETLAATRKSPAATTADRKREGRASKGNIAQVSLSNVMRLSHKLSIKKRHSNATPLPNGPPVKRKLWPSASNPSGNRQSSTFELHSSKASRKRLSLAKQQSAVPPARADPVQLGRQILDAYLEQREREQRDLRAASAASGGSENQLTGDGQSDLPLAAQITLVSQFVPEPAGVQRSSTGSGLPEQLDTSACDTSTGTRQALVKSSSSRKSFKDFKNISRRIFMRHSSNKLVQQTTTTLDSLQQQQANLTTTLQEKRRKLLKIKRSER